MSLVVSSTTDSQEAVNAAAGIEDAGAGTAPEPSDPSTAEETPPSDSPKEPKPEDSPETEDEEQEETPEEATRPRKKGGFQRKIEQLERANGYAARRIEELESRLAARKPAGEAPKPLERPQQSQFDNYDEFIEKLTDWKIEQRDRQAAKAAQEWQEQQRRTEQQETWQERVASFRGTVDDFDDVLATNTVKIPEAIIDALMDSENGPRLAYELAKDTAELRRIIRLPERTALREFGKFEARFTSSTPNNGSAGAKPVALSKAPAPIRPVVAGGGTTTKDPSTMSFQEFKAWRKQHGRR